MGLYLNPGNDGFFESVSSEIYIDKTGLIRYTNRVFRTRQKFICVSRPRRFGKSMAAEMLAATAGLGYMIQIGRTVARPDIVIVGMVVIGAIGAVLSLILSRAEKYFLRWKVNR